MDTSHLVSQTLAELTQSVGNYGSVVARRKGVLGRVEHLAKRGLRKLILRHLDQQREINQAVVRALEQLTTDVQALEQRTTQLQVELEQRTTQLQAALAPPPAHHDLTAFLGLTADPQYVVERTCLRQSILERLEGCSPADATPAEMAGYIGEAALRFGATIELLQQYVASGAQGQLLEIGSNPYFLTLLLKERFPKLTCMGVNYFAEAFPPQSMQQQSMIDPLGCLREVTFFHADVERHSLEALGTFDICLFCEVLEHLPFDPAWALFNIVRTLRPGGLLLLTTPNPARLENLEKMIRHRATFSDPVSGYGIHGRHNREYAASELIELCAATGLTILEAKTIDVGPTLYSRDAEAKGYGAYHMLIARLDETPRLVRPAWLYRSFAPERLAASAPLVPGG